MASTEQQSNEPSLLEVTLGVLLSVSLGALLACVTLLAKPVEKARELPKDTVPGAVYYLEGSGDSAAARQWQRKRQLFIDKKPGEIVFIEDELNAWARAVFSPEPARDGKESAKPEGPQGSLLIKAGIPNFRIRENRLQVAFECEFDAYGLTKGFVVQMRGSVEQGAAGFRFAPSEVWVGGLQVSHLPGGARFVTDRLLSSIAVPEDLSGAWTALAEARVEGRQLILRMP